ncbi:hypothetical protein FBU59_004587 [Linderina macrospora]|uniref:Uncharacterized protein n=1 Tax=Linderina macrospora TaxID=4868 RepID=A0ACC1J5A1_9FUNG|nr:hypothetical protein FBU59_004587 [Linderina macrospora]
MDSSELELYKTQLSEVELALSADPTNTELQALKSDLQELLSLTPKPQPAKPKSTGSWSIGMECLAKYSDGQFYPAMIVGHGEIGMKVTFVGYGDTQDTDVDDLRNIDEAKKPEAKSTGKIDRVEKGKVEKMSGKKKQKKPDVMAQGQQAWLKFATGGHSKKLKAKAINSKSIFKSPSTVNGRVGVSNSGKGMTKNRDMTKL